VVRAAGYFLGTNVSDAEDALDFRDLYDRWITPYLSQAGEVLDEAQRQTMEKEFRACVTRHRRTSRMRQ
jgi:hypothetical protein